MINFWGSLEGQIPIYTGGFLVLHYIPLLLINLYTILHIVNAGKKENVWRFGENEFFYSINKLLLFNYHAKLQFWSHIPPPSFSYCFLNSGLYILLGASYCFIFMLLTSIVNSLIVLLRFDITFALQMDLGVGAFVLANSFVSRQARNIASV